jgi:hypothetical protein
LRSQVRKVFTGDQAYFVRSSSFNVIGGFPDQPLMEDLEIITRLRKIGKFVLLPQYVTTSARRHEKIGLGSPFGIETQWGTTVALLEGEEEASPPGSPKQKAATSGELAEPLRSAPTQQWSGPG